MTTHLTCACGTVGINLTGAPMVTVECHCHSCRDAAARLHARGAPDVREPNDGTRFVLYRKDRVRFDGLDQLTAFRLTRDAGTRRAVAACCNTPVFLEFENGHWLSLYSRLWPADAAPPLEMRTMVSDRTDDTPLPGDVPNAATQSLSFMGKLMGAWIAMGFKVPKLTVREAPHV